MSECSEYPDNLNGGGDSALSHPCFTRKGCLHMKYQLCSCLKDTPWNHVKPASFPKHATSGSSHCCTLLLLCDTPLPHGSHGLQAVNFSHFLTKVLQYSLFQWKMTKVKLLLQEDLHGETAPYSPPGIIAFWWVDLAATWWSGLPTVKVMAPVAEYACPGAGPEPE